VGDYGLAGVDKESTFVRRVEQILNKEHDGWPAAKKLQEQANLTEQPNDSLQKKLDELLREKFNAQKTPQPETSGDINQPKDTFDVEQAENIEQTITDDGNAGKVAGSFEEYIDNDETKDNNKTS
jgi:hypothetical protein